MAALVVRQGMPVTAEQGVMALLLARLDQAVAAVAAQV
jgi:hypothetical protein